MKATKPGFCRLCDREVEVGRHIRKNPDPQFWGLWAHEGCVKKYRAAQRLIEAGSTLTLTQMEAEVQEPFESAWDQLKHDDTLENPHW